MNTQATEKALLIAIHHQRETGQPITEIVNALIELRKRKAAQGK